MSENKPLDDASPQLEEPSRRITIDDLGLTGADSEDADLGPKGFLFAWFQLFRTAQIHAIDNEAVRRPVQNFIDGVNRILASDGSVSLQAKDGTLFLNSVKLSLSTDEYYEAASPVFEFFEERGMGGFGIDANYTVESVHQLLRILVYAPAAERKFQTIQSALQASGLPFRINKPLGVKNRGNAEAILERRAYTFLTYSKLVVLCRSLIAETGANPAKRNYLVRKVSRTVEALVDICLEDDHTFLGISSVKSEDAYAPHHAANTAVLSIGLGEKLGFSKVGLADLGVAAALCDIGLREIPAEILLKGDELDPEERQVLERHTLLSVKFFLEDKHYTKALLRRILIAYEHHRRVDGGGYPQSSYPISLFTKIVAIADAYDALTTNRPWRKAYLPDEALGHMLSESGKQFDPVLLKVFVNTLGLYPVGTLVRLTTGETGFVVYSGGDAERISHPFVAILDSEGKPGPTVDLAEKDPSGKYVREIASSEDPAKYGLQPSGLFSQSSADYA
jgi:HD-GYP domain-containing protein (c-di-GMP phosphodiesterase class II)